MTPADAAAVTETLNAETIALYIGAFMGVVSFGWQVFRYFKEGPKLLVRVNQHMELVNTFQGPNGDELVSISAVNVGSQTTTVTHLVILRFQSRWGRILRRKCRVAFISSPKGSGLTYKLAVGDEWVGLMDQKDLDDTFHKGGTVYVGVYHTFGKGPCVVRVRPENQKDNKIVNETE